MNSEEPFTSNGELSTNCRDDLDVRVGFFFSYFFFLYKISSLHLSGVWIHCVLEE